MLRYKKPAPQNNGQLYSTLLLRCLSEEQKEYVTTVLEIEDILSEEEEVGSFCYDHLDHYWFCSTEEIETDGTDAYIQFNDIFEDWEFAGLKYKNPERKVFDHDFSSLHRVNCSDSQWRYAIEILDFGDDEDSKYPTSVFFDHDEQKWYYNREANDLENSGDDPNDVVIQFNDIFVE